MGNNIDVSTASVLKKVWGLSTASTKHIDGPVPLLFVAAVGAGMGKLSVEYAGIRIGRASVSCAGSWRREGRCLGDAFARSVTMHLVTKMGLVISVEASLRTFSY
eukprot:6638073-Karenia_brevis.AAC.2